MIPPEQAQLGAQLGSAATAGEDKQNLLCAYMAAGVLVGLLANTLIGWRWVDAVIAFGIAGLAVHKGARRGVRGILVCSSAP
jgi:divalent metal cation (Fe/Co/Zn/Cd) transporter